MSEIGDRVYRYLKNPEFYGIYDISLRFKIEGAVDTHVVELESGFGMGARVRWVRGEQRYKVKADEVDESGYRIMLRIPFQFAEGSDDIRNAMARHPLDDEWYPIVDYWFEGLEVIFS